MPHSAQPNNWNIVSLVKIISPPFVRLSPPFLRNWPMGLEKFLRLFSNFFRRKIRAIYPTFSASFRAFLHLLRQKKVGEKSEKTKKFFVNFVESRRKGGEIFASEIEPKKIHKPSTRFELFCSHYYSFCCCCC